MLEALAADLRAHGLEDEAKAVLREPKPVLYTPIEPEPVKPKRRKQRKPRPSKLTPLQASQQAWEELKLRRASAS